MHGGDSQQEPADATDRDTQSVLDTSSWQHRKNFTFKYGTLLDNTCTLARGQAILTNQLMSSPPSQARVSTSDTSMRTPQRQPPSIFPWLLQHQLPGHQLLSDNHGAETSFQAPPHIDGILISLIVHHRPTYRTSLASNPVTKAQADRYSPYSPPRTTCRRTRTTTTPVWQLPARGVCNRTRRRPCMWSGKN